MRSRSRSGSSATRPRRSAWTSRLRPWLLLGSNSAMLLRRRHIKSLRVWRVIMRLCEGDRLIDAQIHHGVWECVCVPKFGDSSLTHDASRFEPCLSGFNGLPSFDRVRRRVEREPGGRFQASRLVARAQQARRILDDNCVYSHTHVPASDTTCV